MFGESILILLSIANVNAVNHTATTGSTHTRSPLATLYDNVLSNLPDPDVRPVRNPHTDAMVVNLSASFGQIVDVDDVQQAVTVLLYLAYEWENELVSWDPNDYGGLKNISTRKESIWKPSINSLNSLRSTETSDNKVITSSGGHTIWETAVVSTVICPLNMVEFPRDSHTCEIWLSFAELTKHDSYLQFGDRSVVDISPFLPNSSSFDLTNVTVLNLGNLMVITFNMNRVPALFDATFIKPVIGVASISPLSLLLPPDSEAKLDLQMTSVLALSVYMMIVVDLIPPYLPDQTPKVVDAMLLSLIVNIVVIVMTTFILRMVSSATAKPNSKVRRVFEIVGNFLLVHHPEPICTKNHVTDDLPKQMGATDSKVQGFCDESSDMTFIVNWIKKKEHEDDIKCLWYHIGMVCDRILMISSLWVVVYLAVNLT